MALKAGTALAGALTGLPAASLAPGRLGVAVLAGAPVAGFLLPDLWLRRRSRTRMTAVELELPDVAELLRVAVQAGLPPTRALQEIGHRHPGLLAAELRTAADRIALGVPRADALARLAARAPAPGVTALASALLRAAEHGAPLGPSLAAIARTPAPAGPGRSASARPAPRRRSSSSSRSCSCPRCCCWSPPRSSPRWASARRPHDRPPRRHPAPRTGHGPARSGGEPLARGLATVPSDGPPTAHTQCSSAFSHAAERAGTAQWEKRCKLSCCVGESGVPWPTRTEVEGLLPLLHLGSIPLRDGPVMASFRGTFDYTLDAKNRLTVPARFRAALSEGVVMAKGTEPCVVLWTPDDYDAFTTSMLDSFHPLSEDREKLERFYASSSHDTELDSAGRVGVPPFLMQHAGLEKDVVVIGARNRIEVWDRASGGGSTTSSSPTSARSAAG
jgi:division/cell wall cluster transcriptional repressor MraZ